MQKNQLIYGCYGGGGGLLVVVPLTLVVSSSSLKIWQRVW